MHKLCMGVFYIWHITSYSFYAYQLIINIVNVNAKIILNIQYAQLINFCDIYLILDYLDRVNLGLIWSITR